jgi:hypothetical protein
MNADKEELYKIIIETMESVKGENTKERLISDASDKLGIPIQWINEILEEVNNEKNIHQS